MQFFGARANLAKSLLYAINGGVDELKGTLVVPGIEKNTEEVLEYSRVITDYKKVLSYVAELYVDAINIIHGIIIISVFRKVAFYPKINGTTRLVADWVDLCKFDGG